MKFNGYNKEIKIVIGPKQKLWNITIRENSL